MIVQMMQAYVMKLDGVNNTIYREKVLKFFLVLAASRQMKAFDFVSCNLCQMSKCHTQRIMANHYLAQELVSTTPEFFVVLIVFDKTIQK